MNKAANGSLSLSPHNLYNIGTRIRQGCAFCFLADAALPLKEAELTETILTLLKDEHTLPEILCNTLTLVNAILTSGTYHSYLPFVW